MNVPGDPTHWPGMTVRALPGVELPVSVGPGLGVAGATAVIGPPFAASASR